MLYYVVEIEIGIAFMPSMGKMAVGSLRHKIQLGWAVDKVKQTHFPTPRSVENLGSAET